MLVLNNKKKKSVLIKYNCVLIKLRKNSNND